MGDAATVILPPDTAVGDDLGVRELLELFVAAVGAGWAELDLRTSRSGRDQVLKVGVRSEPSSSFEVAIDHETEAVLTIDASSRPSRESVERLGAALGRELHRLRLLAEATLLRGAAEATSAGVLLFGSTGRILYANSAADELISKQTENDLTVDWNGAGRQPLFRVLCAQVGEILDGTHERSFRHRLHISDGTEATIELAVLDTGSAELGRVVLATVRKIGTPPEQLVASYAAQHGLSPRESEVLRHLVQGHDTTAMADRLGISPHTVRDHLKNVFRKTATRSRSELVSALTAGGGHTR